MIIYLAVAILGCCAGALRDVYFDHQQLVSMSHFSFLLSSCRQIISGLIIS